MFHFVPPPPPGPRPDYWIVTALWYGRNDVDAPWVLQSRQRVCSERATAFYLQQRWASAGRVEGGMPEEWADFKVRMTPWFRDSRSSKRTG